MKTAEAGNKLEESDPQEKDTNAKDAEFLAEEARRLTALNKLIEEMRDPEYVFDQYELKPLIAKTTQ